MRYLVSVIDDKTGSATPDEMPTRPQSESMRGLRQSHRTSRQHRRDRLPETPPRPAGVVAAPFKIGLVPISKVLCARMQSVCWRSTLLKPELIGDVDAPNARVDMQARQNLDIRPSSIVAVLSVHQNKHP
jgi:hypothetical protein